MYSKPDNDKGTAGAVFIGILLGCFLMWTFLGSVNSPYNPRHAKKGLDTIATNDSVYAIKIQIDSAYEIERDYEPQER